MGFSGGLFLFLFLVFSSRKLVVCSPRVVDFFL